MCIRNRSTQASTSLEDVARNAQAPLCFQVYVQPDRALTEARVRRAESVELGSAHA